MVGHLFGAIICAALIVVGLLKFLAAKQKDGGFSVMLYMAAGVLALIITPVVTMLLSQLLWRRL